MAVPELPLFWDEHPDAAVIKEFAALREKKGDEVSSKLMWYLHLLNDPAHEYMRALPRDKRDDELVKSLGIRSPELGSAPFKMAKQRFESDFLSPAKRRLSMILEAIHQADRAIKDFTVISPEDIATSVNGFNSRESLYKLYEQALQAVNAEKTSGPRPKMFGKDEEVRPADDGSLFSL